MERLDGAANVSPGVGAVAPSVAGAGVTEAAYPGLPSHHAAGHAEDGSQYLYPAPLFIRNTFLDSAPDRPPSLDCFIEERGAESAPASKIDRSIVQGDERSAEVPAATAAVCAALAPATPTDEPLRVSLRSPEPSSRASRHMQVAPPYPAVNRVKPYSPGDLLVKNTFLNYDTLRTPSLDGFLNERQVRSCPTSGIQQPGDAPAPPPGLLPDQAAAAAAAAVAAAASPAATGARPGAALTDPAVAVADTPGGAVASLVAAASNMMAAFRITSDSITRASEPETCTADAMSDAESASSSVQVLRLAEAITEPVLGSPELPTVGSAGHHSGICKPCAFLEKGCTSGVECKFCHLCSPDEKKRRKKEKIAVRRQMGQWDKTMSRSSGNWRLGGLFS